MDWPDCLGCKGANQTLCLEGEFYACKCVSGNEQGVCCVCESDQFDCTDFELRCKCYRQCFCIEWVCGCPLEESLLSTGDMLRNVESKDGTENIYDAIPCNGFCCSMSALYCSMPACFGCSSKEECLCMKNSAVACKPMCGEANRQNQRSCCLVSKRSVVCYDSIKTCVKCMDQVCCIDNRCALPCDNEVPCLYTCFPCCTCCVDWQFKIACCNTVGQLTGRSNAPAVQQQQQVVNQVVIINQTPAPVQVVYSQPQPSGVIVSAASAPYDSK